MRVLRFVGFDNEIHFGQARSTESDVCPGDKVPLLKGCIEDGFKATGDFECVKTVLPPIDAPSIFGVGVNFLDPDGSVPCEDNDLAAAPDGAHARMYALIPHGGLIHTCTDGQPVHFWGQLAVIIRRKCVDVSEEEALDYVGAYSCGNEVSTGCCVVGPVLLMPDDDGPSRTHWPDHISPQNLWIQTMLNGRVVHETHTSSMIQSVAQLVSLFSKTHTLLPGSVVLTGTPGPAQASPVSLSAGDRAAVRVEMVGFLQNEGVAAPASLSPEAGLPDSWSNRLLISPHQSEVPDALWTHTPRAGEDDCDGGVSLHASVDAGHGAVKAGVDIDIDLPSPDLKFNQSSVLEVKAPGCEVEVSFKAPPAHVKAPCIELEVKLPSLEVEVKQPGIDVELNVSDVEKPSLDVDIQIGNIMAERRPSPLAERGLSPEDIQKEIDACGDIESDIAHLLAASQGSYTSDRSASPDHHVGSVLGVLLNASAADGEDLPTFCLKQMEAVFDSVDIGGTGFANTLAVQTALEAIGPDFHSSISGHPGVDANTPRSKKHPRLHNLVHAVSEANKIVLEKCYFIELVENWLVAFFKKKPKSLSTNASPPAVAVAVNEHDGDIKSDMDKVLVLAEKKFKELDCEGTGKLEGEELEGLANWLCKLHLGNEEGFEEAVSHLVRLDRERDESGTSFTEFSHWFQRTSGSIQRFRRSVAHAKKARDHKNSEEDNSEFRGKLVASFKAGEGGHVQGSPDMCGDELEKTATDLYSHYDEDWMEKLFRDCEECPFLQAWPGSNSYPRLGNGDKMELTGNLLNLPPLFFRGTVRSQYTSTDGEETMTDTPVSYAQVTCWVSNDEESDEFQATGHCLGGTFSCDSDGDFWFQAVAPTAYSVLRRNENTGELESCLNPAHLSFECSHSHFKEETMHLFVEGPNTNKDGKPVSHVQLTEVDDPAEAGRRGCQNPFIDVHCDVLLSLQPREDESLCLAEEIMELEKTKGFSKNSFFSVSELGTVLAGTKHEHFAKWLLYNREKNFKKFDTNKDGGINKKELAKAISTYRNTHNDDIHKYYY